MTRDTTLTIDDFVAVTKAFSDPHRVRAIMALREGELCVCQLIELFGLAPSTVSKHMSILKQAGLVDSRKDSRWVYYHLVEDAKQEPSVGKVIKLSISLLYGDEQIILDSKKMGKNAAEALDTICKRKRSVKN